MDRQKLLMIFGGAFAAAALLTWFLYSQTVAPKKEKMVTVLAASADLPAGTRVQKVHLKKISIPQATAPRGTVIEEAQALDRALLYPVTQNEPILSNRLSSVTGADGVASLIEPGKRAVSVSVADAASAGGLIQPRAHVDVLFTKTGSMAEAVTSTVLEDVIVLSVGRNVEAPGAAAVSASGGSSSTPAAAVAPTTGNRSVTLLVTPDQARIVELAKNQGKISLALRNPKDSVKSEEVLSATSETIDPGLMLRTARARAMQTGRMPSRLNLPNLKDDKAWAALVGEEPQQRPPAVKPVEKKEPPKPRAVVDVFRGDKHVQETFQE